MIFTDTHAHLYVEQFDDDRNTAINCALEAGVERFFLPAIDASYIPSMLSLEKEFPKNIFLMMGLHPSYVKENFTDELAKIKTWIDKRPFVAIGEIGIDLYWDTTFLQQQQEAFKTQITWALEKKLPIVIHCRDAFDEIFEVLDEMHTKSLANNQKLYGIFHCFTGTHEQALKAISYNMKLGIGGVATFKNGKIDQFLHTIPLKHIVLETDAPYLAPTPFRGKRNESKYLIHIAEKLASIYQKPLAEIAAITTENSKNVFKM